MRPQTLSGIAVHIKNATESYEVMGEDDEPITGELCSSEVDDCIIHVWCRMVGYGVRLLGSDSVFFQKGLTLCIQICNERWINTQM